MLTPSNNVPTRSQTRRSLVARGKVNSSGLSILEIDDLCFTAKSHDGFHLPVTGNLMALPIACPALFKCGAKFSHHRMFLRQRARSLLRIRQRKIQAGFHPDREVGFLQFSTERSGCAPCEVRKTNNHVNAL